MRCGGGGSCLEVVMMDVEVREVLEVLEMRVLVLVLGGGIGGMVVVKASWGAVVGGEVRGGGEWKRRRRKWKARCEVRASVGGSTDSVGKNGGCGCGCAVRVGGIRWGWEVVCEVCGLRCRVVVCGVRTWEEVCVRRCGGGGADSGVGAWR